MPVNRSRKDKRLPVGRNLAAMLPHFLRPKSKAWGHWNRAAIEFLHGWRAALEECIAEIERPERRQEERRLKRIRVR